MSLHRTLAAVLVAAGFGGLSSAVLGADLPARMPTKAPFIGAPYNWTGFYLGANGGYGWSGQTVGVNFDVSAVQTVLSDIPGVHDIAGNAKGGLGGAQLGYNWQAGRMVYGIELDFDGADISSSQDTQAIFVVSRTFHGEQKLDTFGTLRARLGYTPADRLLVYATGGLAGGHASATADLTTDDGCAGICFNGSTSKTMWGWAAGAGVEYAVTGNWSVKAEYLHYDLGTLNTVGPPQVLPAVFGNLDGSVKINGNIVRAGLNYKFD
ncbi:MAG TPA: outer membrane protein [Pseudolabrys sp.]